MYVLKLTLKSWKHYFVIFWEALQFEAVLSQARTFHMDLNTPINTCPTKKSNDKCLGYVVFESHANFHINWESFARRF